jgi:hypothetical protein
MFPVLNNTCLIKNGEKTNLKRQKASDNDVAFDLKGKDFIQEIFGYNDPLAISYSTLLQIIKNEIDDLPECFDKKIDERSSIVYKINLSSYLHAKAAKSEEMDANIFNIYSNVATFIDKTPHALKAKYKSAK